MFNFETVTDNYVKRASFVTVFVTLSCIFILVELTILHYELMLIFVTVFFLGAQWFVLNKIMTFYLAEKNNRIYELSNKSDKYEQLIQNVESVNQQLRNHHFSAENSKNAINALVNSDEEIKQLRLSLLNFQDDTFPDVEMEIQTIIDKAMRITDEYLESSNKAFENQISEILVKIKLSIEELTIELQRKNLAVSEESLISKLQQFAFVNNN